MIDIGHFNKSQHDHLEAKNGKILIVDDDVAVGQSVKGILAFNGMSAHTVAGGHAAIEELNHNDYVLTLLDLNMPDMGGEKVLEYINNNAINTNVIVISGESEIKKAIHVLKNGARDFIRKPYSADELLFSIKNVLEKIYLEQDNKEMIGMLEESEALHRFIVHNSPDLLYMLDRDGYFVFVNRNTIKLLGYSRKEIIGKHYRDVVHPQDRDRANLFFTKKQFPKNSESQEIRLQGKRKGTLLHVEIRAINIEKKVSGGYKLGRNDKRKENFIGTYGVARDVSERKKAEEIIRFQHNHDLLTGLPNRSLLNDHLTSLIAHSHKSMVKFALLFIDINRFKLINDSYGQSIGDEILRNLAEKLRRCTREEDTLARLGSDEFILLLPEIESVDDAMTTANKIANETALPFKHNGHEIHITLSVGIVIYPEHGVTKEELIKNADTAVCYAKTNTRSRHCLYSNKLKNKHSHTVFVENFVRDAIKKDRFLVLYQPQMDLTSGKLHAAEALVRIISPENTLVLPGKFIDIAEETSLIIDIGEIVLKKVCHDIHCWNKKGIHLQICINISAIELAMDNFAEYVIETLNSYNVNPKEVELEITENILVKNLNRTLSNIVKLTDTGIKIAIDDFGTGYSSLSYLNHLPLNTLKLDRSFMQKITSENMQDTIIPAILNVAKGLQLDFIAEGVETPAQHQYLIDQGSCIAQGFYYSRPIEKNQLISFINKYGIK
ncbi:PAS domain S-box-containing protein/diguanylate cyclase (GGDEF) domain-containing protein [Desulfuromusa kysingii]|uniref:PAS domain S-box-containing protein/diguanylate cyclase (GGDEF) domain-containing protein n=1 Tax=Desulfuromusa kysingii TaxID=37625 RepID=A0A1H3WD32_9BACT|nr:EAL domain-containing protein [Desulfuromusa kysingii]SDZ84985.1 PAS domain S-box-containing protein/diguanylate cyclase (GGDEF) domain-containing protein [Desulfuromusa kysingii]